MGVSIAKVFESLGDAKAATAGDGKEAVFRIARHDNGGQAVERYVVAKNANDARMKISKFLGDELVKVGDAAPREPADKLFRQVARMTPEEQVKLRELLAQQEGAA